MTVPSTPEALASFVGGDPAQNLTLVMELVKSYTRGRGFADGEPEPDVAAVILTATARLAQNPTGSAMTTVGPFTSRRAASTGSPCQSWPL